MEEMIKNGEFLEYAQFGKNYYGTSKQAIRAIEDSGRICILDLELQGVRNVKKLQDLKTPPKFILIRAPSLQTLVDSPFL
jgi:guanylate kinase